MAALTEDQLGELVIAISMDLTKVRNQQGDLAKIISEGARSAERKVVPTNDNIKKSFDAVAQSAAKAARATSGSSANIAAQFQDIAVGIQGGQGAMQIALQQGTQLASVFQQIGQSGGNLGQGLAAAFGQIFNLTSIVTIGAIAAAAAIYKMFTSGGTASQAAIEKLDKEISKLKDLKSIADATGATTLSIDLGLQLDQAQVEETLVKLRALIQAEVDKGTKGLRPDRSIAAQFLDDLDAGFNKLAVSFGNQFLKTLPIDAIATQINHLEIAGTGAADTIKALGDAYDDLTKAIARNDPQAAVAAWEKLGSIDLSGLKPDDAAAFSDAVAKAVPSFQDILKIIQETKPGMDDVAKATDAAQKKAAEYNKEFAILEAATSTLTKQEQQIQKLAEAWAAARVAALSYGDAARADAAFTAGVAKIAEDAAAAIGTQSSATSDYAKIVNQLEGTGKNPMSSARGKFQFIDSTFIEQVKKLGLGINLTDAQILKLRDDTDVVDKVFANFTEENAAKMRAVGVAVNDTTKYMAHFLGAADAIKVLKAPPDSLIGNLLSPGKITANRGLLGRAGETVADFQKIISARVAKATSIVSPTDLESSIAALKVQTEELENGAKSAHKWSEAIDQAAHDQAFAEEQTKLLAVAAKDGSVATAEQTAAINAQAEAFANAKGHTAAYTDELKNNKVWQDALNRAEKEGEKATDDLTKQKQQTAQQMAQFGTTFITSFVSGLEQGKSAAEALRDSLKGLADQLLQMILNKTLITLFESILGVPSSGTGLLAKGLQTGGMAGTGRIRSGVSPFTFFGAPRMASGGFVGVGPGEFPTILHRGEMVIPASMVRSAMGMSSSGGSSQPAETRIQIGNVSITTTTQGTGDVKGDTERGKQLGRTILATVQAEITRQSRPGGLLTASGSAGRVGR